MGLTGIAPVAGAISMVNYGQISIFIWIINIIPYRMFFSYIWVRP